MNKTSPLFKFLEKTKSFQKEEIIKEFENDEDIKDAHKYSFKNKSKKETPKPEDPKNKKNENKKKKKKKKKKHQELKGHFISFIEYHDLILEMDSRRDYPIIRGKLKTDLIHDSCELIKKYFEFENVNGSILFLCEK